jgi:hypothetical protein
VCPQGHQVAAAASSPSTASLHGVLSEHSAASQIL